MINFYQCSTCEQVHMILIDKHNALMCCGEETEILNPITIEIDEDHVPVVRKTGAFITLHFEHHPMLEIHRIQFIVLETDLGFHHRNLDINKEQQVEFIMSLEESARNIYIFCNVHGLFKLPFSLK